MSRRARALARLYPPSWQRRYGEEFIELLGQQPLTLAVVLDVLRGAVSARARAAYDRVRRPPTNGPMTALTALSFFATALFYGAWSDIYNGDHGGEQEAVATIAILYAVLGLYLCLQRWWIHGIATIAAGALALAWQFSWGPVPGWQENNDLGQLSVVWFLIATILLGWRTTRAPVARR